jgi:hypothetical protein
MSTLYSLGKNTKNLIFKSEGNKLSEEFTVGATAVKQGMPVKLDNSGNVIPWVNTDGEPLLIGIAMTDQAVGELVTVWTRGYMVIKCIVAGAVNCGPATYSSYDASTDISGTTGYNVVAAATVSSGASTNQFGWLLDAGVNSGDVVRVLIKN